MRVLSLFSGIGAHDLGLQWAGMEIAGQIEIEEYCQEVLKKHWPKVPKWRDITTVSANDIRRRSGKIDLITGGFPCQDISTAGKQKGIIEGERSGLWREMWRLIKDLRPDWLLLENVPALRVKGADGILAAVEAIGYTCWPVVVGAWSVKAPHQRNRVLILAHRNGHELRIQPGRSSRASGQEATELGESRSTLGSGDNESDNVHLRSRGQNKTSRIAAVSGAEVFTPPVGNPDELTGTTCKVKTGGEVVAAAKKRKKPRSTSELVGDAQSITGSQAAMCERVQAEQSLVAGAGRNVVNAGNEGLAGRGLSLRPRSQKSKFKYPSPSFHFPAPPGYYQHPWEAPRTLESAMGVTANGTAGGLGRFGSYVGERRDAIKAIGNANPPQVFYAVGRAIMLTALSDE